jgi:FkbM family methyltransferase
MSPSQLLENFRDRLRYKHAKSWQKPLIDPSRFARNQYQMHSYSEAKLGHLRIVSTFHCPEFTVVTGEKVSETIASYGIYEESLTEAFLHLVKPGQVVVDIGMHIGYYATVFAALVGPHGAVHAFEPTPSTRDIARANVEKYPQVQVHPFAVWSQAQELEFRDYGIKCMAFNSFTDARVDKSEVPEPKLFKVQTITLDQFRRDLNRPVSLAKVDAEGAELEILRGAKDLLTTDRPILTLEVGDAEGQTTSRRLLDFLETLEYAPWEFTGGAFVRHQPRQTYRYDNLILAPASRDLAQGG